jgi:hypothetical protein
VRVDQSRFGFLPAALVTAAIVFKAQSSEYRGLEHLKLAGRLVGLGIVGTGVFVFLAFKLRKLGGNLGIVLSGCLVVALPFLVDWLLTLNGTPGNIHGIAILGYMIFTLGSWISGAVLLVTALVRTVAQRRNARSAF